MALINIDELNNAVVQATQDAWRRETNTTINSIVEFIIKESFVGLIAQLEEVFSNLQEDIDNLYDMVALNEPKPLEGIKVHANEDGGVQEPKRNPKGRPAKR